MMQDNGWACCGIPDPKEREFDWRKKAEEQDDPEERSEEAQE